MRRSRFFSILAPAAAAFAFATPGAALADDFDMDCKLLLCLPGGFPDGCADALDHMMDRLRDGKSPIGTCGMAGGGTYDDYDIDYEFHRATEEAGWECDQGENLSHSVSYDDSSTRVTAFCYTGSSTVRFGSETRTVYTGTSRPERTDMSVDMRMNVSTGDPYETERMRFNTGYVSDFRTHVRTYP